MTLQDFLLRANDRCRARLFTAEDYDRFQDAIDLAGGNRCPYYVECNAGGVANSYGSSTTTAQWAVWRMSNGQLATLAHRIGIRGRNIPCAYGGGERAYRRDFVKGEASTHRASCGDENIEILGTTLREVST
jgi:hypothetical protein